MSGGPVFDEAGVVCGVVGAGYDNDPVEQQQTSFVSATPYIFMLELKAGDESMRVYEMVQRDLVASDMYFEHMKFSEQDGVINMSVLVEK